MNAETWLPILTLILGWAGAQITDLIRDRRTNDRERQIRRSEMQRATLLELQDALLELLKRTTELRRWRLSKGRSEPALVDDVRREGEAIARMGDADAKVELLGSRVLDADARRAVTMFASTCDLAVPQKGIAEPADMKELSERYTDAIDRLGVLIRERY
jgi:hypothetical protein